jgi:hypothetical protein
VKCDIKLIETNGHPGIFFYTSGFGSVSFVRGNSMGTLWSGEIFVVSAIVDNSSQFGIDAEVDLTHNTIRVGYIGGPTFTGIPGPCSSYSSDLEGNGWITSSSSEQMSNVIKVMNYSGWNKALLMHNAVSASNGLYCFRDNADLPGSSALIDYNTIKEITYLNRNPNGEPQIFYVTGNNLVYKQSNNNYGSSWPYDSTILANSLATSASFDDRLSTGAMIDNISAFVYRKTDGIYFHKGYNIKIVDGTERFGNFGLVQVENNIYTSYYRANDITTFYEIWVSYSENAPIDNSSSNSSNSTSSGEYIYSYFDNGTNLLNRFGGMTGNIFVLPGTANTCALWGYSGNEMHNLKLEDVDHHRILCQIKKYAADTEFSTIQKNTRLRLIVNDGVTGDIMNSYEVKFKFNGDGDSSDVTESFGSESTESSQTNSFSSITPTSASSPSSESSESSPSSESSSTSNSSPSSDSSSPTSNSSPSSDSSSQTSESSPSSQSSASSPSSSSDSSSTESTFNMLIQTTTAGQSFSMYLEDYHNFYVDWGNGTVGGPYSGFGGYTLSYSYATPGQYTVSIWGHSAKLRFENQISLKRVLGSLKNIIDLNRVTAMFRDCTSLISVPVDLFNNMSWINLPDYNETFSGCSSLSSIPSGLFNFHNASSFMSTFKGCAITSIPAGLFDAVGPLASRFDSVFSGCYSLSSIPSELFRFNINAINFNSAFYGCSSLSVIPSGLFSHNSLVTDFANTFYYCYMIYGNVPTLWISYPSASGTGCFYNCYNATNYGVIPVTWR